MWLNIAKETKLSLLYTIMKLLHHSVGVGRYLNIYVNIAQFNSDSIQKKARKKKGMTKLVADVLGFERKL